MKQILLWLLMAISIVVLIMVNIALAIGLIWVLQRIGLVIDYSPVSILASWLLIAMANVFIRALRAELNKNIGVTTVWKKR